MKLKCLRTEVRTERKKRLEWKKPMVLMRGSKLRGSMVASLKSLETSK